ncbi:NAD(P)/FAD-dependent oxidoreductase [Glycomyces salinus]|uniref:NAD(P)/FAD-dependent oxidoreductase n=1 Tax=Glycomyces salinus TaxID=980294 RepID=UPI0018EB194D|nr:FAD-dependent oxidoreductase [Glycomyces salinus]
MKHRIVVLGAGYAGTSTANSLAKRLHPDDFEITVVDAETDFVERIRYHQLAVGQRIEARPLAELFEGTAVRLRVDRVTGIAPERRTVALDGGELDYDTLVYALGSTGSLADAPGAAEHVFEVGSRAGALRLRKRLDALGPADEVLVVGGGLTGIEAATEIAEARPDLAVALAARGEFAAGFTPAGRRYLRRAFDELGVTVHEHTSVERIGAALAITDTGRALPSAATIWSAGFAHHPIAAAAGLATDEAGRIEVDRTMRSVSHPSVWAVGDAALAPGPKGSPLLSRCASALPASWQAADEIAADLTGSRRHRMPVFFVQQCVSLGRERGLIQAVSTDDRRPRKLLMTGRTGARYKEMICRFSLWLTAHPLPFGAGRRRRAKRVRQAASV